MKNGKRLALGIFWTLVGAALIALSAAGTLDPTLYAGMGGALAGIGVLRIVQAMRYDHDESYREATDIRMSDERNRFLRTQSWAWTGYAVVVVEGAGILIATVLGHETVQMILSYSVCLIVATYWLTYTILSRRY